jgi:hypothetical protein
MAQQDCKDHHLLLHTAALDLVALRQQVTTQGVEGVEAIPLLELEVLAEEVPELLLDRQLQELSIQVEGAEAPQVVDLQAEKLALAVPALSF